MRGKIRDKYAKGKSGFSLREESIQRHPYKRESRTTLWIQDVPEDEEDYDLGEDEQEEDIEEVMQEPKR